MSDAHVLGRLWSGRRDSNPRPQPWQGCALPLSYARTPNQIFDDFKIHQFLEGDYSK